MKKILLTVLTVSFLISCEVTNENEALNFVKVATKENVTEAKLRTLILENNKNDERYVKKASKLLYECLTQFSYNDIKDIEAPDYTLTTVSNIKGITKIIEINMSDAGENDIIRLKEYNDKGYLINNYKILIPNKLSKQLI